MMFRVKAIILVVLAFLLSAMIVACGGSNSNTSGNSSSPVTISYWTWNPSVDTVKQEVTAFEKQYPTIHVDYKVPTYTDYLVNLKAAANAGSLPTVFGMQVGGMEAQYLPNLQPLQSFAQSSLGSNWQDKFVKTGLQQAQIVNQANDTNFYTLPESMGSESLLVNTAIFKKYNLPIPQTFTDLQQDATVLNSHGVAPMLLGGADGWQNEDLFLEIANQVAPNAWYQAQKAGKGFDSPGLEQAMGVWKSLFTNHIVQSGAMGEHAYPDAVNAFNKGQGATTPLGSWVISGTLPGPGNVPLSKDWSMILFPKLSASATPLPLSGADVLLGMSKGATGAQADAGWKFIQFLTQGEGQNIYVNDMIDLPAQVGLKPTTLSQAYPNANTMYQQSVDWANQGTLRYVLYPQLDQALISALATVATGQATPAAALSKLNGVVNQQQ
jgi:raffinose/stachyose/melibiose transport system substrate-binding protein